MFPVPRARLERRRHGLRRRVRHLRVGDADPRQPGPQQRVGAAVGLEGESNGWRVELMKLWNKKELVFSSVLRLELELVLFSWQRCYFVYVGAGDSKKSFVRTLIATEYGTVKPEHAPFSSQLTNNFGSLRIASLFANPGMSGWSRHSLPFFLSALAHLLGADDVVSRADDGIEDGVDGGQAGAEGKAVRGAVQRGQGGLRAPP